MTTVLAPLAVQRFCDTNNIPVASGQLFTYQAGTTTPAATYTDSTGGTPNANPIILDAFGQANIWLTQGQSYKFTLKTAVGVTLWTVDNIIDSGSGVITLTNNLAASSGSGLVGFIQAGAGAVARTVQARLRDTIDVRDYGALGDGVTNDTAALNLALAAAFALSKSLFVPAGTYRYAEASGGAGYALMNKGVSVVGEGRMATVFAPLSSFPNTADFMRIVPNSGADISFLEIADFFVYTNIDGTARGKKGIAIDASMLLNMSKLNVHGLRINACNGAAFECISDQPTNQQGVPAFSKIEDNIFYDQLRLSGVGDSTVIRDNFFNTPTGSARVGIYLFHVDIGPGTGTSSHSMIYGNAMDCDGGALQVPRGRNIKFFYNNVEMSHGAGSNGAVIDLDGSGGTMGLCEVRGNHLAPYGTATATSIVRLNATKGAIVEDNTIASGNAMTNCILITSSSSEAIVGKNGIQTSMFTNLVNDSGIGTCGFRKAISITAAGVAAAGAGYDFPSYYKSKDNVVQLFGAFAGAAIANNTILTTLPAAYRPSAILRFVINATVAGAGTSAAIEVNNIGEVKLITESGAAATFGTLSGISYPLNSVNYDSIA